MRTLALALIVVLPIAGIAQPNKTRKQKMNELKPLIGSWELHTKMISPSRPVIEESGSMTCRAIFDSTYIECDTYLTYKKYARSYKVLITYATDSSRYEQVYFYNDSPARIIEYGQFENKELLTQTSFRNSQGNTESITVSLKFTDHNNLFMESRSSATNNEVDYQCTFRRKGT